MKKQLLVFAVLILGTLTARESAAMSKEALERDEAAVLEIPELTALASPGDHLPKELELQSYSLGASHDVVGSSVTANVVFQDLSVTRISDEWTPVLMKAAIEGKKFKHATLEVKHPHSSVVLELRDVAITSVSSSDNIPSNGTDGYLYINCSFQGMTIVQSKGDFKSSSSLKNPPKIFSASGGLL